MLQKLPAPKLQKKPRPSKPKKGESLIKPKDIEKALRSLEWQTGFKDKPADDQLEPGFDDHGIAIPQWAMPVIQISSLKCPFTEADVTTRVMDLTKKVIDIIFRHCVCKPDFPCVPEFTFMPLAASFLAFQSCYFR